jgi:hypothetical protein
MRKAVFLTAYNRLPYLQEVLRSWELVRGLEEWRFVAMIEPSPIEDQIKQEFESFALRAGLVDYEISVNPQVYGVLHHPWVGFEQLMAEQDYEFVVRAEDDLLVSDDILEYFSWAAATYQDSESVATVHAFSTTDGSNAEARAVGYFRPWIWGTWRDRWIRILSQSWDHDYSTFNGVPGNESGWDWNITSRILPSLAMHSIAPVISRTSNIGIWGVHGTAENHEPSPYFKSHQPSVSWLSADSTGYV